MFIKNFDDVFIKNKVEMNKIFRLNVVVFLPCTVSCTWRWVEPAAFLAVHE